MPFGSQNNIASFSSTTFKPKKVCAPLHVSHAAQSDCKELHLRRHQPLVPHELSQHQ